jgi:hypothetical protein
MLRDELAPSCRMTKTNFAGSNTIISSTSSAFVCVCVCVSVARVEASCAQSLLLNFIVFSNVSI